MNNLDENYRIIAEYALDVITRHGSDGSYIYVSPSSKKVFGQDPEELIGTNPTNEIHPEDLERFQREYNEQIKHGNYANSEYRRRKKDGTYIWVENRSHTIFDQVTGGIQEVICVIRDITERKIAEETLRQRELKYNTYFRHAPLGYQSLDRNGIVLEVNDMWLSILGYTNDEVLGRWFGDFIHPDHKETFRRSFPLIIERKGIVNHIENHLTKKDGTVIIADYFAHIERDEKGNFLRTHCIFQDVTESRKKSAELKQTLEDLSRFNKAMIGRELRMIELKKEINSLLKRLGEAEKYKITEELESHEKKQLREDKKKTGDEEKKRTAELEEINAELLSARQASFNLFDDLNSEIQERKKSEETLLKSEKAFRLLFESMTQGVFYRDPSVMVTDANPSAIRMLGLMRDEFVGANSLPLGLKLVRGDGTILPDEERPSVIAMKTGKLVRAVTVGVFNPGEQAHTWMIVNAIPEFITGEDIPYRVAVTLHDITHLKHSQQVLEESVQRFKQVAETVGEWIWEVNTDGLYTYSNNVIRDILGYTPDEIVGQKHFYDFFLPEEKEILKHGAMEVFAARQHFRNFENRNAHRDGHTVILSTSGSPVLSPTGDLIGYRGADTDITPRLQMEDELQQSHQLLQDLNQYVLEAVENERGRISREIHDELGQSLSALKMDLEMVCEKLNRKNRLREKVETMIGMVANTIKDVQRISSELRPGLLDDLGLSSAFEWYCEEFEKRTGLSVLTTIEETDGLSDTQNTSLFRILQESLTNVMRHAQASRVEVEMRHEKEHFRMMVSDDGIGFLPEVLGAPTSLGLLGIRERVRQISGTVEIYSSPNAGTKLIVSIPITNN